MVNPAGSRPDRPMTEPTPEELLAGIASGCRDSFSALYDSFHSALYGIAFGVTRNHSEAQEILQEAFLSIWKKSGSYDPRLGKASTWIIHLTRNLSIDRLRKRQRHDAGQERLSEEPPPEPLVADPVHRLISRERARRVREELRRLPDDQRLVLELAFYEGMTQSEIAERLGEPLGTIKSRIRRAMERVRSVVSDLESDNP